MSRTAALPKETEPRREPGGSLSRPLLIVTGDDFGQSSPINQAILSAHRDGILTSASLLVNEPGFEEAVGMARSTPTLAVGLHLALSASRSTLPPREIPGLVDARGRFLESPARAGWRYYFRNGAAHELEWEIRAQIEKFLRTGLPLDHLDGHQHLHLHPTVFPIVARVCAEYRVPGIRIVRDPLLANLGISRSRIARDTALWATFGLLGRRARRILHEIPLQAADRVHGLLQDGRLDGERLRALLGTLKEGTTEIYTHPSMEGGTGSGRWGRQQYEALIDPATRRVLDSAGVMRVTYGWLSRAFE